MSTLVTSQEGIIAIILVTVSLSFLSQKIKKLQIFGSTLPAIILGILLSNINVVPHWHDFYGTVFHYAVPVSIAMMLLDVNIRDWLGLSKQPFAAMLFAVISIVVVTAVSGFFFIPLIDEGSVIAAMFIGTYTGGSANLTAIGTGLGASAAAIAQANAADYVIGLPSVILLMLVPTFFKKSKTFQKFWPHTMTEKELAGDDSEEELFGDKNWAILDIAMLLAISFSIVFVSKLLVGSTVSMHIILITTIALLLAQIKPIREIKGNVDLGYFIAMIFFVVMGMYIDLAKFLKGAPIVILYCAVVIFGSILLHLLLCRIFKIKMQYVLIAMVAGLANGVIAASIAGSARWKSIISTAVVLGAIGAALGNYLGIGLGLLLESMVK